jgi:predicted RNA binding protein YcfA (HicA-like mRNA interferase family)
MKLPRDLSAEELIKILTKYGYEVSRQKGSHIRLVRRADGSTHHVTIPNHNPLKLGTLSNILSEVCSYLNISKEDLLS